MEDALIAHVERVILADAQGFPWHLMSSNFEQEELTPNELMQAYEHWEALMFASSRYELRKAQLALLEAPASVQRAVMESITQFWLSDYEPSRHENPFR